MQIEIARLEDELVKKEAHYLSSKQASDRLNAELRGELDGIKSELINLQKSTSKALMPDLALPQESTLVRKVQKHLASLTFQKKYLQLSCRTYKVLLGKLTSKTYKLPCLTGIQKFKRATYVLIFIHRLKKASNRKHSMESYKEFNHRLPYQLPSDL